MTYDKNYTGSTGSAGTTGSSGSTGYSRTGSYSSPSYGSSSYGSPGYESFNRWDSSGSSNGRMLVTLLIGAAAGAAIALLTAPTTGREARHNLQRWARDTKDRASHMASRASEMAGNVRGRFSRGPEGGTEFSGGSTHPVGSNVGMNEDRSIPEL